MRLALLEDDIDQVALFNEWLTSAGHTCEHFDNGKSFVRNIKHDSYDALILDWMVPDMDGLEVLRWVRENFDWPIPIVFVTAKDSEDDIFNALEHGADDYVVKPYDLAEIEAKTKDLTEASSGLAQKLYAEQQAQTESPEGGASKSSSSNDDAVDAEFEEVKEEDK